MADKPKDALAEEKARAKSENSMNREKQRVESKQSQWNSPEQMVKTGEDVHPEQKVVASQPAPQDDPELKGTRYDPNTR